MFLRSIVRQKLLHKVIVGIDVFQKYSEWYFSCLSIHLQEQLSALRLFKCFCFYFSLLNRSALNSKNHPSLCLDTVDAPSTWDIQRTVSPSVPARRQLSWYESMWRNWSLPGFPGYSSHLFVFCSSCPPLLQSRSWTSMTQAPCFVVVPLKTRTTTMTTAFWMYPMTPWRWGSLKRFVA